MRVFTRLLIALSISSIGVATCFAIAPATDPDARLLCQEVDIELVEAVRQEILTEEEAIAISQRCYTRYYTND